VYQQEKESHRDCGGRFPSRFRIGGYVSTQTSDGSRSRGASQRGVKAVGRKVILHQDKNAVDSVNGIERLFSQR